MKDILIIAIVFAVPISAIVSWAKIKLRRLELEAGAGGNRQLEDRLARLERERAELEERIGTLESIVTMDAPVQARTRVRVEAAQAAAVASAEDDAAALALAAARRAGR
jgi:uncharacterized coiled-coil protein SlyX